MQDALALLRRAILAVLDVATDQQCIIDSLPLPVVQLYHASQASPEWAAQGATFGKCASKKQTLFGYKLHLRSTLGGVIQDFELAPAHAADVTIAAELLEHHHDLTVLGDKGYSSAALATALHIECNIRLLTLPRANQPLQPSVAVRHLHNHLRQMIETVNSQLVQQLHLHVNHAHSFWGVTARLLTKLYPLCLVKSPLGQSSVPSHQAARFPQLAQLPSSIRKKPQAWQITCPADPPSSSADSR